MLRHREPYLASRICLLKRNVKRSTSPAPDKRAGLYLATDEGTPGAKEMPRSRIGARRPGRKFGICVSGSDATSHVRSQQRSDCKISLLWHFSKLGAGRQIGCARKKAPPKQGRGAQVVCVFAEEGRLSAARQFGAPRIVPKRGAGGLHGQRQIARWPHPPEQAMPSPPAR